ncbi:MAG: hypothetical protein KF715_20040 [Candidatus Didemnitutus sp.]|nr:hypothetical protein [Candidatus Didemnitutus sp.]
MTPRLQLLPPCNLIGYNSSALPSENALARAATCNLLGYNFAGAGDAAECGGSGDSGRFEAEILELTDAIGFGGDCA